MPFWESQRTQLMLISKRLSKLWLSNITQIVTEEKAKSNSKKLLKNSKILLKPMECFQILRKENYMTVVKATLMEIQVFQDLEIWVKTSISVMEMETELLNSSLTDKIWVEWESILLNYFQCFSLTEGEAMMTSVSVLHSVEWGVEWEVNRVKATITLVLLILAILISRDFLDLGLAIWEDLVERRKEILNHDDIYNF